VPSQVNQQKVLLERLKGRQEGERGGGCQRDFNGGESIKKVVLDLKNSLTGKTLSRHPGKKEGKRDYHGVREKVCSF